MSNFDAAHQATIVAVHEARLDRLIARRGFLIDCANDAARRGDAIVFNRYMDRAELVTDQIADAQEDLNLDWR